MVSAESTIYLLFSRKYHIVTVSSWHSSKTFERQETLRKRMCHIDFCLIIPISTPFCYYFVRGTFMQIEQELVNNRLHVSKVSWKSRIPNIYNFTVLLPRNFPNFLKVANYFLLPFLFISKTLLSNKTGTATNTKICAVFVICVETILYLLLYNLHDCTFNIYL